MVHKYSEGRVYTVRNLLFSMYHYYLSFERNIDYINYLIIFYLTLHDGKLDLKYIIFLRHEALDKKNMKKFGVILGDP